MPIFSNSWPAPEQVEPFREHLRALELPINTQTQLMFVARSLVRHTECSPGRLRAWVRKLVAKLSFRQACRHIRGAQRFMDFCGHPELGQMLDQVSSCADLVRALAKPGTNWEQALHLARKPAFESGIGGWLQAYLDHRSGCHMKLGGWVFSLRKLDRLALQANVQSPEQITPDLLQRFLTEGQSSPCYHNIKLSKLRVLQRFLVSRGVEFHVPTGLSVKEPPFRPHIFNLYEIGGILRAARRYGRRGPRFHWLGIETIIYLLYACGMRISEPLGLRICDVDLQQGTLFLNCTKFYKQRWVPMGKGAVSRLDAYWKVRQTHFASKTTPEEPFFLNTRGGAFRRGTVESEFFKIVKDLGLESRGSRGPRPHDLRHTLAVHKMYQWYAEGKDVQNKLPLLSAYLGHDRLHHTEVYLHLTEDLIRQAGRNFQRSFEEVVGHWRPPQ